MRIGLDAKRAFCNSSGLGNYSRMFIRAMISRFPEHSFFLFSPYIKDTQFYNEVSKIANVSIITPQKSFDRRFHWIWRRFKMGSIAKDLDLDIFHGLSQELPFCIKKSEAKKIVTIHDLIAFHPDYAHEWFNTFFYKRKIKHAINNASVIIAISQQTADDLKQNFHIDEKKLHIIYQPVDSSFFKRVDDETKRKISEKYNLPARYILQPGNLQYRKNHLLVINALKEYPNQDLHYVIVGKPEKYLKTLQATVNTHQLQNRIHFLFEVPTTDLPALYQMSQCVIYPSLIEGYGLPIVEAMASYVPIITSKGGCFEEAGGKAAWYINPQNSEELVSALHLVLSKNEEVERRLQEGLQKASLIKAPQMADTYMQVYTSTSLT